MDFNWKFHLGNEWGFAQMLAKAGTGSGPASISFNDASWRTVNLPHDWVVELPFDEHADMGHGFKPVGLDYLQTSIAWYRRTLELSKADVGKRLWLEFDGVYRDCDVFVNGWFVGHHDSGYDGFRFDITDVANCAGTNLVAVRVNATQFEGWFYEGAGIYRHVWLVKTAPLAIAPDGIFVYSRFKNNVPGQRADVCVQAKLLNSGTNSARATVDCEIDDPQGRSVGTFKKSVQFEPSSEHEARMDIIVRSPELWSPESPKLYTLVSRVESGGQIVDRQETMFGIRTVAMDPDKGFLLNGKPYEIKGTCNHQDAAGVGVALPDALQYFRIRKLKEMGCNAYRTSHNAPTPELLDACDRLGMLVMDENRTFGSDAGNLKQFEGQILRDRNHPSVAIWSVGNEEWRQNTPAGGRVGASMQAYLEKLDPTRPITAAENLGAVYDGLMGALNVRGWNYHVGKEMDDYHAARPEQPEIGTEQGSTVSTRGIYANDPTRGYVSAYDTNAPSWATTAESWWSYFAVRPWLSGGFVWTGFDYRGEPTPYAWPCISSYFGILDTCGFPKDNFWYYQAWWTDKPVLHLLPHWNWPGLEGKDVEVWCYSNCREVELFLNGKSLGRKMMKPDSHLAWMVKYEPGELSAVGYNDGKMIAKTSVETTGKPAEVQLAADRADVNADGEDVSVVAVSVCDAQHRVMPLASNLVHFSLSGPGKILGVGNGDPSCHEPDIFIPQSPVRSVPENSGWHWQAVSNIYDRKLPEFTSEFDDTCWDPVDVTSDHGPMGSQETAIFRTKFSVTSQDVSAQKVALRFNMIHDNGYVYVNGRYVGECHDNAVPVDFDVKPVLKAGENIIAVGVVNNGSAGGLSQGVQLEFQDKAIAPNWQRSVFNGLAEILVQSTKEPGEVRLTASADGLSPATLIIHTRPCATHPYVQ